MKIRVFCLSTTIVLLPSSALADIIHVPGDYPTIQAGIDASSDGDTVLAAPGTYAEHINFDGKDITVTSEDGPEFTNIELQTAGIPLARFEEGESSASVLSGFTLRLAQNAPAVNIDDSSPLIKNNIFLANDRGGIKIENGSSPQIIDNVFVNNNAPGGGAIYCSQSDVYLESNRFIANSVSNHGGAVYLWQSSGSIIHHNLFYQNLSHSLGGAICLSECQNVEIYNNTISFNATDQPYHGGGIAVWDSHECDLYNNIITENSGEGIFQGMIFSSSATYNDVWNNTDDYYGIDPGEGSISADPLFNGGVPFSFELTEDSPCIDAGDPNSPYDPDGTLADIGAFYFISGPGVALDIGDIIGFPETIASVPIMGFSMDNVDIAGLEFHIDFDDSRLEFYDISSDFLDDALVNVHDGRIHLVWENHLDPINIPDSASLLEMMFSVNGQIGDSCHIGWADGNELADPEGEPIIGLNYYDGYIEIEETVDITDRDSDQPRRICLKGNYPNPFNGNTTIEFGLSYNSRVTVEIYDILGGIIETVISDNYPAGNYSVTWSSADKPSGIYFYKITIDGYSEIGKMSLIK